MSRGTVHSLRRLAIFRDDVHLSRVSGGRSDAQCTSSAVAAVDATACVDADKIRDDIRSTLPLHLCCQRLLGVPTVPLCRAASRTVCVSLVVRCSALSRHRVEVCIRPALHIRHERMSSAARRRTMSRAARNAKRQKFLFCTKPTDEFEQRRMAGVVWSRGAESGGCGLSPL